MKKILCIITLLCCALSMSAQDKKFWVYLCIGQSNMAGMGAIEKEDSVIPENLVSLSAVDGNDGRKMGEWRQALPPIVRADSHLSMLGSFGKTVLEHTKGSCDKVGMVAVAVEGCPIIAFDKDRFHEYADTLTQDWSRNIMKQYDFNPYQRLITLAKQAQRDGVIKGILLHQGETDAYSSTWNKEVRKIYYDILNDLQLDSTRVPLLVGEVGAEEYHGNCSLANKTIDQMHNVLQHSYVVSSAGCPLSDDHTHFSNVGYRRLGKNYGVKMIMAMGLPFVESKHEVVTTTTAVTPTETVEVKVQISDKGMLYAQANHPLYKIIVLDSNDKELDTITLAASDLNATIDLNKYPEGKLTMVFYATNGADQSFTINN